MSERSRLVALLTVLALIAGLLTWGIVARSDQHCLWAVTIGTDRQGYAEIPCGLTPRETFEYLREHPDLPLTPGPSKTGGVTLKIYCKPGNRPAPGNDPANC